MEKCWYNVQHLDRINILVGLQKICNMSTTEAFQTFIQSHNSGRLNPAPYVWSNKYHKGFLFYEVLTFGHSDQNSVIDVINNIRSTNSIFLQGFLPFGITKDKKGIFLISENAVSVYDTQEKEIILISNSFESFYQKYLS